ncbi:MAG: WYL domain-containing protein [Bacteroidales bacterium]|nr:WYL domain-containing protein [Bacteroidales bacterium]
MATNKNAILRYNTLDKCFSNFGRKYYIKDLLEKVNETLQEFDSKCTGIKTRQLRDDIRVMRSDIGYNAPIIAIREGNKAYYRYEDRDFSINNSPLNKTEAEHLKNAISILQRFEGAPQFEWINEIGPMLSTHFGLNNNERKVMSYDTNIDYTGYDKIMPVFNAIINERVLEINYKPFDKEAYKIKFHPYYLKQYNNRWFVFGLDQEKKFPKCNLALDRILNINECSEKYIKAIIDWDEHFYDIIGVSTQENGEIEEVELIFSKKQANYIKTKPLHPSQKAKFLDTGELKVLLKLIPNTELEMNILFFGEDVKVIKPMSLKSKIKSKLKKAVQQYF